MNKVLFFFCLVSLFSGCASQAPNQKKNTSSHLALFNKDYLSVFEATKLALKPYSLKVSSIHEGIFETGIYKDNEVWKPQHKTQLNPNIYYKIEVKLQKIQDKKTSVKVVKFKELKQNFQDPQTVPSDHVEEKLILYRIKRELILESLREKVNGKLNPN